MVIIIYLSVPTTTHFYKIKTIGRSVSTTALYLKTSDASFQ